MSLSSARRSRLSLVLAHVATEAAKKWKSGVGVVVSFIMVPLVG